MESLKEKNGHVISILESIKGKSIETIKMEEEKKFETIIEYDFKINKVKIIYKDGKEEEVFLKIIKSGKIKESIFCYWSILYEEYLKENTENNDKNIVQKAIITQVTSDETSSSIILTINAKLDYCVGIDLIELKKYYNKNFENRRDSIDIKEDEILFIGKKMY